MILVCDTSVLYAALDEAESDHEACTDLLSKGPTIVTPSPTLVEIDQLAQSRQVPRATDALLASVEDGSILVAQLDLEDYVRVRELVARYADFPLSLVDASVVAVAERLEQDTIATLDRRHFSVVRPLHVPAFKLLP